MATLYDLENAWGDADDFFLAVVDRRPGSRVVDLGCGTGTLTIAMAGHGHEVTGVEPNQSFLAAARRKPGAGDVTWLHGTSARLPVAGFDTAVMTGHVVHAFIDDGEWAAVLADLRASLVAGGTLVFDSLDPDERAWERFAGGWKGELPGAGPFESRSEIKAVAGDVVTFEVDTVLPGGERRWGVSDYRFRSAESLRQSVERAGFTVDAMFGGWHGEAVGHGTGEIVVLATASHADRH